MTAPDSVTTDIVAVLAEHRTAVADAIVDAALGAHPEDQSSRAFLYADAAIAAITARLAERGGEVGALAEVERRIEAERVAARADSAMATVAALGIALRIVREVAAQQPPDPLAEGVERLRGEYDIRARNESGRYVRAIDVRDDLDELRALVREHPDTDGGQS